jgi:hypothetical protein
MFFKRSEIGMIYSLMRAAIRFIACAAMLCVSCATWATLAIASERPNILFVGVDDLRPEPGKKWKTAAFSRFHRYPRVTPDGKAYMGYSMVTDRYHYVEWRAWSDSEKTAGTLSAVELYDLQSDPSENVNLVDFNSSKAVIDDLSIQLQRGWRSAVGAR